MGEKSHGEWEKGFYLKKALTIIINAVILSVWLLEDLSFKWDDVFNYRILYIVSAIMRKILNDTAWPQPLLLCLQILITPTKRFPIPIACSLRATQHNLSLPNLKFLKSDPILLGFWTLDVLNWGPGQIHFWPPSHIHRACSSSFTRSSSKHTKASFTGFHTQGSPRWRDRAQALPPT